MRAWIALFLAAVLCAAAAAQDGERIASVLAQDITRGELAADANDLSRTLQLLELIWRRIVPHYVAQQGLAATAAEVAEVAAYDREFVHKDRSQRARKLEELNQRLGKDGLSSTERAWLEEFRAVLQRLTQNDLDLEEALTLARRAVELDAENAGFHGTLAEILHRLKRAAEALTHIKQAIALDPEEEAYREQLREFQTEVKRAQRKKR